jgi:ankyrin repeat protein
MMAASRGHGKTVDILIAYQAKVDVKNNVGNTALMLAVLAEDEESVRSLLGAKADIDIRNNKREQAIDLAQLIENKSIIKMLHDHDENKKMFGVF